MRASGKSAGNGYAQIARAPGFWPPEQPPALITAVSTEEEFDWSGPFRRDAQCVSAIDALTIAQALFDAFGVRPTYLVDYPVVADARSRDVLGRIHADRRCEIGAHLHPWVSPPHEEEVSEFHSFPGNLPMELERRKIHCLTEILERSFGARPTAYQAGRYGFGDNTAAILDELGYLVDLSASPAFDLSAAGGPNYADLDNAPFWFGRAQDRLAVPITGAYVGVAARVGPVLHRWFHSDLVRWTRVAGILARGGVVERIRLSPEGCTPRDLERLTQQLLNTGVRTFVLSMHSPSFQPGCTPYVRTESDLQAMLGTMREYYEFFFGRLGGVSVTASELREQFLRLAPQRR